MGGKPDVVRRLVSKLSGKYQQLLFCYEAVGLASTSRPITGMPSLWPDFTGPGS